MTLASRLAALASGACGMLAVSVSLVLADPPPADPLAALLARAAIAQSLGQSEKAFGLLQTAVSESAKAATPAQRALVFASLSDAFLRIRRLDDAVKNAEQAVALAQGCQSASVEATAYNHLGNALTAQRDFRLARSTYQSGLERARQSPDPALLATLHINQLHLDLAEGTAADSLASVDAGLSSVHALPRSPQQTHRLIALGYLAQRLSALPRAAREPLRQRARAILDEALEQAESAKDARLLSHARGQLGEWLAAEDRHGDASTRFRQALFAAAEADAPELSARWHWQLGRSLAASGDPDAAKSAYRRAVQDIAPVRAALIFGDRGMPGYFHDTVGAMYRELLALLLDENGARTPANLREARDVLESLRGAELQSYYLDECVAALQEKRQNKDLAGLITPGSALIYTMTFPDRLLLLVNFAGGELRAKEVRVSEAELTETLAGIRKQLVSQGNPRRLRAAAISLYDWLIRPIRDELAAHRIDTLVFAPDEALRTLPFAALHDGRDFLIRDYAVAISPGLSLTEAEAGLTRDRQALRAGLSVGVQGFGQLPNVNAEIDASAELFAGRSLKDDDFVKDRIQAELRRTPYGIVSFATHAQISGDPRQSFLLTYDNRISLDELERYVRTSELRKEPLDLLILSACDTAEGDERAALGLAGVAVKAGTRSVMASLWEVSDASTAELVPAFLKSLKAPGVGKAQALRRAQLALLDSPDYRHPYFWAPFVLIGQWQ